MSQVVAEFKQVDSWFFRESRPHGSVGANALNSVFPPPTRTLMGAIRSYIGYQYFAQHNEYNWDNLDNLPQLQAVIGHAERLGSVQPRGVFIKRPSGKDTTYYLPAPSNICKKFEQDKNHYLAFKLTQKPYQTDIGHIHLATLPEKVEGLVDSRGFKPLENTWISTQCWQAILEGDISALAKNSHQICKLDDFINSEYRLGIELQTDFSKENVRSVKEGQLYQTTHLRLAPDVSVVMPMQYDADDLSQVGNEVLAKQATLRLGGEARMANVQFLTEQADYLPKAPKQFTQTQSNGKKRFMLYFISKLIMQNGWLPQGFTQNQAQNGFDGNINDIAMTIVSACMGKAYREGGWNQLEHKPRPIENYLPAGTALFIDVDESINDSEIIAKLHGKTYLDNAWGEGLMLVGKVIQN